MFQRIVVPLDGSERAERALSVAARLARASGGSILLLRIVTAPIDLAWSALEAPVFMQKVIDMDLAKATEYMAHVATSDTLRGIETHTRVLPGEPSMIILSAAQLHQANLIVMCSHGDTGVKRWMVGSVAQKVTRKSPVPVLVLHEGGGEPSNLHPGGIRPVRVLVALDGSRLAETAVAPAAQLSAALSTPMQGELHLAHVLSLSDRAKDSQNESIVEIREQLLAAAKAYLETVERRLRGGDLADVTVSITSSVAIEKDVAGTLIAMAENGKQMEDVETLPACDLISMATHGRGGLKRWIMGSVTERVLGATRLPLLIVRPQQVDTPDEKADKNNGSELVEGEGTEVEAPAWVGLL